MRSATLTSTHFPGGPLSSAIRDKTHPARTLACPKRHKTRHAHMLMGALRYKTRPARTLACPKRYKTRHTPQKSPILAHFRHAGRKLSRSSQKQPKQGEFSLVVSTNNRSRATCGAPPAAFSSHGARLPHRDHLFAQRKAGAHTAFISTMSRDDWDSEKEISPLLGNAPVDMKY